MYNLVSDLLLRVCASFRVSSLILLLKAYESLHVAVTIPQLHTCWRRKFW